MSAPPKHSVFSRLPSDEPVTSCAKIVWNNPWQLRYADPFGDGTVIRVNLENQTDAGRLEEAAAILKHRHPDVKWIIA